MSAVAPAAASAGGGQNGVAPGPKRRGSRSVDRFAGVALGATAYQITDAVLAALARFDCPFKTLDLRPRADDGQANTSLLRSPSPLGAEGAHKARLIAALKRNTTVTAFDVRGVPHVDDAFVGELLLICNRKRETLLCDADFLCAAIERGPSRFSAALHIYLWARILICSCAVCTAIALTGDHERAGRLITVAGDGFALAPRRRGTTKGDGGAPNALDLALRHNHRALVNTLCEALAAAYAARRDGAGGAAFALLFPAGGPATFCELLRTLPEVAGSLLTTVGVVPAPACVGEGCPEVRMRLGSLHVWGSETAADAGLWRRLWGKFSADEQAAFRSTGTTAIPPMLLLPTPFR